MRAAWRGQHLRSCAAAHFTHQAIVCDRERAPRAAIASLVTSLDGENGECVEHIESIAWTTSAAVAHPGGLNKHGCHNDRKNGGYHCHRSATGEGEPTPAAEPLDRSSSIPSAGAVSRNCAQARAAGAAPVRRGDPGYGPHLDRDHDGVGCEPARRR
ncbi:excalibur calcium-binding domain-containing protein [Xanthomonas cassavae CFBP 4642]|uniref:Excalibur calcium-binding domain-containing protein n=1 Tax=Xanthomonas cassavae CFBP 4642 TaxID=1219375 RepID=A0ABS8HAA3_9XANT|nr:excalibur calcium-binding domain-containing protein [Xanthomonas cassavae]MCC4619093.1 excalibur calcium-binding domain-containing protein [Xanthomonas cassavae CFBP 4642]